MSKIKFIFSFLIFFCSCGNSEIANEKFYMIQKDQYSNKLEGFWLGQSIANWTGLITEMDQKIKY